MSSHLAVTKPTLRSRSRLAASAVAGALAIALLTGCSADPEDNSNAAGEGNGGLASSGAAAAGEDLNAELDAWYLKFAQCMRNEGIDIADPTADGVTDALPMGDDNFDVAQDACIKEIGQPPASDVEPVPVVDAEELYIAQCLRAEGFDMPDPIPGMAVAIPIGVSEELLHSCIDEFAKGGK